MDSNAVQGMLRKALTHDKEFPMVGLLIMLMLKDHPNQSGNEIHDSLRLDYSRAGISRVLSLLKYKSDSAYRQKDGYEFITSEELEGDRRTKRYSLTKSGKKFLDSLGIE